MQELTLELKAGTTRFWAVETDPCSMQDADPAENWEEEGDEGSVENLTISILEGHPDSSLPSWFS